MQSQFNAHAINMLPVIKHEINAAKDFERDQMIHRTLEEINNLSKPLAEQNALERLIFQNELLDIFARKNWISHDRTDSCDRL